MVLTNRFQYTASDGENVLKPLAAEPASQGFHSAIGALWLGYLCFVVYGSLVPFDFKPIPVDQALARFGHISLINVGTEGRADWIANGVLYAPLGFLTALTFRGRSTDWFVGIFTAACAIGFSFAMAIGVEFVQLFFPPRTVSLNDLIAEAVGAGAGVFLAVVGGRTFRTLWAIAAGPTGHSPRWLLWAYAMMYLAFSIFPLDFVLSSSELGAKAASSHWGWWMARSMVGEARWSHLAKLVAEVFMAVPIGLLLANTLRGSSMRRISLAVILAVGVGVVVELLQFLLISGVSQGASVVARATGICFGVWAFGRRHQVSLETTRWVIHKYAVPLAIAYLPLLAGASGWFSSPWQDIAAAMKRLVTDVNFTPFFYHYFTTEAQALFSLAAVSMLYAPVGLVAWAYRWSAWAAVLLASSLAAVVEAGKLFATAAHPDPTNIWIAGAIAGGTMAATRRWGARPECDDSQVHGRGSAVTARSVAAMLTLCFAVVWLSNFPTYRASLGVALLIYVITLWRNPSLQFTLIPASLPLLDLAPLSGRFFLDEFDWLIMVGLAVGYVRLRPSPRSVGRWRLATALATAVAVSFALSCWRALEPWHWPDANAFNSYLTPFNALRVAKGALWAVLWLPLMLRAQAADQNLHRRFQDGMVIGLAGVVLFVLWERASFASLLDFADPYRISGPVSAMHIGGAYLECYLTVATAFLIARLVEVKSRVGLTVGVVLLIGAVYAVMVTYSRGGYLALVVLGVVMMASMFRSHQASRQAVAIGALLLAVALVVAAPVWRGAFAQSRLATVERDLGVRDHHWRDALALRTTDWPATFLGMGVGQFPVSNYFGTDPAGRTATYQLSNESGNMFLRLGAGRPLFMDQIVALRPNTDYILNVSSRVSIPGDAAMVQLCHKWLLAAADCREFRISPKAAGKWLKFEQPFNSGVLGADPWFAKRPVKLTLQSGSAGEVHFDDVQLVSASGEVLLANGSFSSGLDHWNFTSDEHLSWHVKQLAIAVFFDQGVLGLVVIGLLVTVAVIRSGYGAWRRDLEQATTFAALAAFMAVGLFDSLVDSPRYLFLFLAVCFLAVAVERPTKLRSREDRNFQA